MVQAIDMQSCWAAPSMVGSQLAPSLSALVLAPGAPSCCFPHRPETPCPAYERDLNFEQAWAKVVILGGDSVKAFRFEFCFEFWVETCAQREVCVLRKDQAGSVHTNF